MKICDKSAPLKITLIENYALDAQQSMLKFGELMAELLVEHGVAVDRLAPQAFLGKSILARRGLAKWLGYIDKYLIFPFQLAKYVKKNPERVYHIVDHSNAVYEKYLRACPLVITCHDLMAIASAQGEVPQNKTAWSGRILQAWILSHLKKVKYVVCDSEKTSQDVLHFCKGGVLKVTEVVHICLNGEFKPLSPVEVKRFLKAKGPCQEPYFLHVGGNQWYKNRPGVVRLFSHLIQSETFAQHHLILAGKPWSETLCSTVKELNLEPRVHELTDLPFESLLNYYCGAEALLFVSLSEGYGWPILEAQACGTWAITSNREPMTEVGGTGASYVDPEHPEEAARRLVEEFLHKGRTIESGRENVKKFNRNSMLQKYHQIYLKASAEPHQTRDAASK